MNPPKFVKVAVGTIPRNKIAPPQALHERLPSALEDRIRKLEPVFAQVYPISYEEWLFGFRCDLDPEFEVRVWEAMASAYQSFLAKTPVMLPAKQEAFGLLLGAMGTVEETLARIKVHYLRRNEAKELLRLYSAALRERQQPFSPN